jgi:linoleoyl-CoA desaturase
LPADPFDQARRRVSGVTVKFDRATAFHQELKARVAAYFETTGKRERGLAGMYLKTAIILTWFAVSYVLLVFVAASWWQSVAFALSLGFSIAGIGFNIQHDGSHGGYSRSGTINRVMACALDLVGGSSYFWHWKHNVLHHSFPNIAGADDDINVGVLARLAPAQRRYFFHRFQHFYMWALYGIVPLKWQLVDDFRDLASSQVGEKKVPPPRGFDLALFWGGKALFVTLAFVIPSLVHPFWVVLLYYLGTMLVLGVVLATIFQLAHCVEEAGFPMPEGEAGRIPAEWAVHQVQTTVDFAQRNKFLTWYLGGLNFQIEHHLFPRISHLHYPSIAPIVKSVCESFGVKYNAHRSVLAAARSHFQWLRQMGRPESFGAMAAD